ncbi:MAG: hypothetical protein R3B90_20290 [Planctomycetaceae bacterium]
MVEAEQPAATGTDRRALMIGDGGMSAVLRLLGCCVLWMIADYFQRYYFARVLSRSDLYEYAKASRQRSDRLLRSLPAGC